MGYITRVHTISASALLWMMGGCTQPSPQQAQLPTDASAPKSTQTVSALPAQSAPNTSSVSTEAAAGGAAEGAQWPAAEKVIAANLDGEGPDELVIYNKGGLSLWAQGEKGLYALNPKLATPEVTLEGAPNRMTVADLDQDGREDVLLGYGMARGALTPPISVAALQLKGESGAHALAYSMLYQLKSERPEVTALELADVGGTGSPSVLLVHFDSKYFVSAKMLELEKGPAALSAPVQVRALAQARMATSWAIGKVERTGKPVLVAGRPYGDEKLAPGDLSVVQGESKERIPTQLGVRSVTIGDGDGDGSPEVYFGDGWHYEYGTKARGRLSFAKKTKEGWKTELIEDTKGQYEIAQIQIADVDGDKQPEIIAAGDKFIRLYWKEKQGWMTRSLASGSRFALTRTRTGLALAVPGTPMTLVSLEAGRTGGTPVSREVSPPGVDRR